MSLNLIILIALLIVSFLSCIIGAIWHVLKSPKNISPTNIGLTQGGIKAESEFTLHEVRNAIAKRQWHKVIPMLMIVIGLASIVLLIGVICLVAGSEYNDDEWFTAGVFWMLALVYAIANNLRKKIGRDKTDAITEDIDDDTASETEKIKSIDVRVEGWPPHGWYKPIIIFTYAVFMMFAPVLIVAQYWGASIASNLLWFVIIVFFVYFPLWFISMVWLASRLYTIPPQPNIKAISKDVLLGRLDQINELSLPFKVIVDSETCRQLVWEYSESSRSGLINKSSEVTRYTIKITLDETTHTAKIDEYSSKRGKSVTMEAGVLSAGWSADWFHGIDLMPYAPSCTTALHFYQGNWAVDQSAPLDFSSVQLRYPIIEVVCASGWRFKPVLTLGRWVIG